MTPIITSEAVFENGVFQPNQPLSWSSPQPVTLVVQLEAPRKTPTWPQDVAQIYQDLAYEDQRLAQTMEGTIQELGNVPR